MSFNNSAGNIGGSSSSPPPPNPILNAYEQFVLETPFVTRSVLTTLAATFLLSCLVDISFASATIPYFCLWRFELHRLFLSPLVCQSFLTLIFAFLSLTDNGKRLEHSVGSTAFAWYLLTIGMVTNFTFLLLLVLANSFTGDPAYLMYRSLGIWTILFGLVATECSRAPQDSKRRLFFVTVPTLYYPLALWGLFALIGGFDLANLLSVGVGYACGRGYLDILKLSPSIYHRWEETILANFTQQPGWVVGHAAAGADAWTNSSISSGFSLVSASPSSEQQHEMGRDRPGSVPAPSGPTFPVSGGRALGSGPTRRSADCAAVLAAAERRATQPKEMDDQV